MRLVRQPDVLVLGAAPALIGAIACGIPWKISNTPQPMLPQARCGAGAGGLAGAARAAPVSASTFTVASATTTTAPNW